MSQIGLALNQDKCSVVPFSNRQPKGTFGFLGFRFYWGRDRRRQSKLKVKTDPKRLSRCMVAFEHWIKTWRNRCKLAKLWELAAAKLTGHYRYFGITFNQSKLEHFYWVVTQALFKWLNRRSQRRSFTWKRFLKRIHYQPLPLPPAGYELKDMTRNDGSVWNRKPRSRMRENRTSGSVRSASLRLVFT